MVANATPEKARQTTVDALPPMPFQDSQCFYNPISQRWIVFPSVPKDLLAQWQTIGKTDGTVLITGETGTGKEEVAGLIASNGPIPPTNFGVIDCGSIPEALIDTELFGCEKGAHSTATTRTDGKLAQYDGGTVFLDELGKMPKTSQGRLLRFLQSGEIQRVGAKGTEKLKVRVLAATNAPENIISDLKARFTYKLDIPPLRDRPRDIIRHLARFFWPYDTFTAITPRLLLSLLTYSWPGNVRELEKLCEAVQAMARHQPQSANPTNYVLTQDVIQPHQPDFARLKESIDVAIAATAKWLLHNAAKIDRSNRILTQQIDNTRLLILAIGTGNCEFHPNVPFAKLEECAVPREMYDQTYCFGDISKVKKAGTCLDCFIHLRVLAYVCERIRNQSNLPKERTGELLKRRLSPSGSVEPPSTTRGDNASRQKALQDWFGPVPIPSPEHRHYAETVRHFTRDEQEILRLKTQGLSVRQIARQIGSSSSTIQEKIQALRDKCHETGLKWAEKILAGGGQSEA